MSPARTLISGDTPTVTTRRRLRLRLRHLPTGVIVVEREVRWPAGDRLPVNNPAGYRSASAVVQSGGAYRMEPVR